MKQGCRGGPVDPTAPKARLPVQVVSQAANILDPAFVSGIEFHLHALLGDAFTAGPATAKCKYVSSMPWRGVVRHLRPLSGAFSGV